MNELIETVGVSKVYNQGKENEVKALQDVNLVINRQDFICIMGPSGSGKSTLVNILSTLDHPTKGQVMIDGVDVKKLSFGTLAEFRGKHLGFVFQNYNLLPSLSLKDNIAIPLAIAKDSETVAQEKIRKIVNAVQMEKFIDRYPFQCSGGQCQRAAIARALVHQPDILVADEPTGNLDSETAHDILQLLYKLNVDYGITIIMVTHDPMIASYAKQVLFLRDGWIEHEILHCYKEQTDFYHEIMEYTSRDTISLMQKRR